MTTVAAYSACTIEQDHLIAVGAAMTTVAAYSAYSACTIEQDQLIAVGAAMTTVAACVNPEWKIGHYSTMSCKRMWEFDHKVARM